MSDLPPNSHKSKGSLPAPEKKEVPKVVLTEVKQRKKPLGKRMTEMFFGGGDARTIWGFIAYEILVPSAKDLFVLVIREGSERAIYGESMSRASRQNRVQIGGFPGQSHVNYGGISSSPPRVDPRGRAILSHASRSAHNFGEIVIDSRAEAMEVLERLVGLIAQYEVATVADLYDLCGVSSNYQDSKWGWEDLRGSNVRRARGGGFVIDLPSPVALT